MAYPLGQIGSLTDFSKNLSTFCQNHFESSKAKGFVFIFDHPKSQKLRRSGISNSARAAVELERIAGEKLTIFYLDSLHPNASEYELRVSDFNQIFLDRLGFSDEINLPGMLFFRIHNNHFTDFQIFSLARTEDGFIFYDIKEILQGLANKVDEEEMTDPLENITLSKVKVIKGIKDYSIETFKLIIESIPAAIAGAIF